MIASRRQRERTGVLEGRHAKSRLSCPSPTWQASNRFARASPVFRDCAFALRGLATGVHAENSAIGSLGSSLGLRGARSAWAARPPGVPGALCRQPAGPGQTIAPCCQRCCKNDSGALCGPEAHGVRFARWATQTLAWASSYYLPHHDRPPMAKDLGVTVPTVSQPSSSRHSWAPTRVVPSIDWVAGRCSWVAFVRVPGVAGRGRLQSVQATSTLTVPSATTRILPICSSSSPGSPRAIDDGVSLSHSGLLDSAFTKSIACWTVVIFLACSRKFPC